MKKLKAGSGNSPSDPNEERAHVGTVVVLSDYCFFQEREVVQGLPGTENNGR